MTYLLVIAVRSDYNTQENFIRYFTGQKLRLMVR